MANQNDCKTFWLGGPDDRLCAREQAKAWALREVWMADGKGTYGLHAYVAGKVRKTKNGKPNGDHPAEDFERELRLSPFGARKLVQTRARFLEQ